MSAPTTIILKDGRRIQGTSVRLNASFPENIKGPLFSFQTTAGWVWINMTNVAHIQTRVGRPT
jgi:hypothetical protein